MLGPQIMNIYSIYIYTVYIYISVCVSVYVHMHVHVIHNHNLDKLNLSLSYLPFIHIPSEFYFTSTFSIPFPSFLLSSIQYGYRNLFAFKSYRAICICIQSSNINHWSVPKCQLPIANYLSAVSVLSLQSQSSFLVPRSTSSVNHLMCILINTYIIVQVSSSRHPLTESILF